MSYNLRQKDRFNFKTYGNTGNKVSLQDSQTNSTVSEINLNSPFHIIASSTDSTHLSSDSTHLSSDSTHLSSDSTHLSSDSTQLSSDQHQLSSDSTHLSSDQHQLSSDSTHLSSDQPQLSSDQPQLSSDSTHLSSDQPQLSSDQPQLSSDQPQLSSNQHQLSSDQYQLSTGSVKSSSISNKPTKIYLPSPIKVIQMEGKPEVKALLFSFMGYQDEILDIIQDYSPPLIKQSTEVMKRCITDIQALRKNYRDKDRELRFYLQDEKDSLESYEQKYGK